MRKEYGRNKKIVLYGTDKAIGKAEAVLDTLDGLDGLDGEMSGYRLNNEGAIRLTIQDAIYTHNIKATILVDGNTVYPYKSIVKQYEQLRKSGTLEKMTDDFYKFLSLNFDIAHYSRSGYIAYYNNDFACMKESVLDGATTPNWHTDVARILHYIQDLRLHISF